MKILYTENAIHDLQRLHDFLVSHNPHAAQEISNRLRQAVNRLLDFPMLGGEVKNSDLIPSLRDLVTGKYIIRYMSLTSEIHILRIWHNKEERNPMQANKLRS